MLSGPELRLCRGFAIWHNAAVKRVLWLLLAAALLVWGGALFDFGAIRAPVGGRVTGSPAGDQDATNGAEQRPKAAPSTRPRGTVPVSAAAKDPSPTGAGNVPSAQSPFGKLTSPIDRVGAALVNATQQVGAEVATGELGEGVLSPEYADSERLYIQEPRDGPWAREQEQRVRDLFEGNPLKAQLVLVHCQETICRIVLEGDTNASFKQLLTVPGLRKATAIGPATPFSLRTGQLSVFFRRSEEPLDGP